MRNLKNLLFAFAVCVSAFAIIGCTDDDNNNKGNENAISQTIEIQGVKYSNVLGLYHQFEGEDEINIDIDTDFTGDNNVHGFGYFDASLIGKTVQLTDDSQFNISFNYMTGGNFTPRYKSGTLTITKKDKGYHILLNSVNADDSAFKMDMLLIDEEEFNRSQQ